MELSNPEYGIGNIPVLADCSYASWDVIAVSGAHMVFRYGGSVPELQLRVLKVRKHQSDAGWGLRLGFTQVLRELRKDVAVAHKSVGEKHICDEHGALKLYSSISPKYLPLQEIVRVPQTLAYQLLARAADKSTHVGAPLALHHPVQVRQDKFKRASSPSSGMPSSNAINGARQPLDGTSSRGIDTGSSEHGGDGGEAHSYTLGLLEEDLVAAPRSGCASAVLRSSSANAREDMRPLSPPSRSARTQPEISTVRGSKQKAKPHLLMMYYAVELKPKCGLLERLDEGPLTRPAGSYQGLPARVKCNQNAQRTRLCSCSCSDTTPERVCGRLSGKVTPAFSRKWGTAASIPDWWGLRHPPEGRSSSLHVPKSNMNAAGGTHIEREKSPIYCLGNRFPMQQYSKLKAGCISRVSAYDPIEFFKCTPRTIRRQLYNLVDNPQNNMKVYVNGSWVADWGSALTANAERISAIPDGTAKESTQTRADKLILLLLERIWEREKDLFAGILVLQAFAAGQQHLSVQLVRELKQTLGLDYETHREERFMRDVNLYLKAASSGITSLQCDTFRCDVDGNGYTLPNPSKCGANVLPAFPTPQRSSKYVDAAHVQRAHERAGFAILDVLRAAQAEKRKPGGVGDTDVSSVVTAAFCWLHQYLLGRTFMDVSVFTNILITDGDTLLAAGAQEADDRTRRIEERFEQLELDEELADSAAQLVEDTLRSATSARDTTLPSSRSQKIFSSRPPPTILFRVTVTDMDFKSDRRIDE